MNGIERLGATVGTRVKVVDSRGAPIVGAALCFGVDGARCVGPAGIGAESSLEGWLDIPGQAVGEARAYWIAHREFVPTQWKGERRVVMTAGESAEVRVIDYRGSELSNVSIAASIRGLEGPQALGLVVGETAAAERRLHRMMPGLGKTAVYSGVSDERGMVRLSGMSPGLYQFGCLDPDLRVVGVLGGGHGSFVDVPGVPVDLVVARGVGVRVEFVGEQLMGRAYMNPRGWRLSESSGCDRREDGSIRKSWLQFEATQIRTRNEPAFTCFVNLSRSGPVRLDLAIVPVGDPDYLVRRAPTADLPFGVVRVSVSDLDARDLDCQVRFTSTRGSSLSGFRNHDMKGVRPDSIAWGARSRAGRDVLLSPGVYHVDLPDSALVSAVSRRTVTVVGGDRQDIGFSVPDRCQSLELSYAGLETVWSAEIEGRSLGGRECRVSVDGRQGKSQRVILPFGEYRLHLYQAGSEPQTMRVTVDAELRRIEVGGSDAK